MAVISYLHKTTTAFRKKYLLQQDAGLATIQQCELGDEFSNYIEIKEDYSWLEEIFSNVTLEDISYADM